MVDQIENMEGYKEGETGDKIEDMEGYGEGETGDKIEDIEGYVQQKGIAEFLDETSANMESAQILAVIEKELEQNSIESLKSGDKEALETAVEHILETLEQEGIESVQTVKTYSLEQKAEAVAKLYQMAGQGRMAMEAEDAGNDMDMQSQAEGGGAGSTGIQGQAGGEGKDGAAPIVLFLFLGAFLSVIMGKILLDRRKRK